MRNNIDLKNFETIFNLIARKHGYYRVFEDFLNLSINSWCFNYSIDLKQIRSVYNEEERLQFGKLIKETILILDKKINNETDWFDVFGSFYEEALLSKQKGFSQYFTPHIICDFMAQIVAPQKRETVADPACGSARMSLALNKISLGAFHFLVDLDYTCAKMSALNLMLHGIHGIVISDDGLFPGNNFKGAFIINRNLRFSGVPQIEFINDINKAYDYVRYCTLSRKEYFNIKNEKIKKDDFKDISKIINSKTHQYSMF